MSDYLTPQAREHWERASRKGCECGLCTLIVELPLMLLNAKADGWDECSQSLFYEDGEPVAILKNTNPYRKES